MITEIYEEFDNLQMVNSTSRIQDMYHNMNMYIFAQIRPVFPGSVTIKTAQIHEILAIFHIILHVHYNTWYD